MESVGEAPPERSSRGTACCTTASTHQQLLQEDIECCASGRQALCAACVCSDPPKCCTADGIHLGKRRGDALYVKVLVYTPDNASPMHLLRYRFACTLASGSVEVMLCMSKAGACEVNDGSAGRSTSTRLQFTILKLASSRLAHLNAPTQACLEVDHLWHGAARARSSKCKHVDFAIRRSAAVCQCSTEPHLVKGLSDELNISSAEADATQSGGRSRACTCTHHKHL